MTASLVSRSRWLLWSTLLALAVLVPACGFGTGVLIGSSSGGGGGAPAAPASFLVMDYKSSPAMLRLVLAGEQDAATVDFFYVTADDPGTERPMQHVENGGVPLAMSPAGVVHLLAWDFASEDGLAATPRAGVRVIARTRAGSSWATVTTLGGDAPVVDAVELPGTEVSGVVPVNFRVADGSGDVVDIRVEFTTDPGPAADWQPARPAGITGPLDRPTFEGVVASPGGVGFTFHWDTDSRDAEGAPVGDLAARESNVRLRFVAEEREVREPSGMVIVAAFAAAPTETPVFRVDNNDAPAVTLDNGAIQAGTDRLRGVPVHYGTSDFEADPVPVLFQWARTGEDPPTLGPEADTPEELLARLADRGFRSRMHICSPYPVAVGGRPIPVDAMRVRLPELAQPGCSWLLSRGMRGLELELLRPEVGELEPVASNFTRSPIAVAPIGDGLTAFVIAADGGDGVLAEIDLVSGVELRPATRLAGVPTALGLAADGRSALVATDQGGLWRLFEVGSGASTLIASAANPPGPVRGIAALGSHVALATVGSALLKIDWRDPASVRVATVRDGLAAPSGLAVDPRRSNRVFVAESSYAGVGRVVAVDLAAQTISPVVGFAQPFSQPSSLALRADGSALLVLCQGGTGPEVRAVRFGPALGAAAAARPVPNGTRHLATGPDRLLVLSGPAGLRAGGGIEQRRTIAAVDGPTWTVAVDEPFVPALRTTVSWRLRPIDPLLHPVMNGQSQVSSMFVWDSRDVPGGGEVFLRAQPLDTDFGDPVVATASIRPKHGFEDHVASLPSTPIAVADIDGDGGDDLLVPVSSTGPLRIFRQRPGGGFSGAATVPIGTDEDGVAVADMNGDGRADVITADSAVLRVSLQRADGTFDPAVDLVVPGGAGSQVAVADLYGDGRPDLISNGHVFLQPVGGFTSATAAISMSVIGSLVQAPVPADFHGDGGVDFAAIVVDSTNLGVAIARQNATGGFVWSALLTPSVAANTSQLFEPVALAVADFDGDGLADVAAAYRWVGPNSGEAGDRIVIHQQLAGGRFSERRTIGGPLAPALVDGIEELTVADVNSDGRPDLLVNLVGTGLTVLFQEADGGFHRQAIAWTLAGVAAGDFNSDGAMDVLPGASFRLQATPRVLTAAAEQIAGPAPQARGSVAAIDRDADGVVDLCSADDALAALLTLEQPARGAFQPGRLVPLVPTQQAGVGALLGVDLNGDGASQLLVGFSEAGAGGLWLDPGTSAGRQLTAAGQPLPEAIAAADLDGDGDLDVATAGLLAGSGVRIYRNDDGVLQPAEALGSPACSALALADLDGDGRVDLAATTAAGIEVYRQSGGPLPVAALTIPGVFVGVFAADFNGDGRVDLAASSGPDFVVFFQRPGGAFGAAADLAIPDLGEPLAVTDLDGDGRTDVIGSSRLAFQVESGAFTSISVDYGSSRRHVIAVDLDTDGDLELVSVNPTLLIWRGR
ncbi:MAG: VCBS repeat-containing protein [bacterium]|nr:VCBS repeat-containing protein [bacterium]